MESLIKQRVYGMALGYEDLNDHDTLRHDVLLGVLGEKEDPSGARRRQAGDRGKALAGKSTLNRLELTPERADAGSRYKKIVADWEAMDKLLVELFLESYGAPSQEVVIDVDATDDPLHGHQEGRFFHGYYGHYCYLPLYFFCGDKLLCARLREADEDPAAGVLRSLLGWWVRSGGCGPRRGSFCAGIAVSAGRRSCIGVRPSESIMCWGWRRIAV